MPEKTLDTLVADIYEAANGKASVTPDAIDAFSRTLAHSIAGRLLESRDDRRLRLSNLGSPCDRKLWFSIHHPDLAEEPEPNLRLKFLLGDVWEAVLLFLARVSGHRVEMEQEEISLHGVIGHMDAVVDGTVLDVKSASSYSFDKFDNHLKPDQDSFGYLTQIDGYLDAVQNDDRVTNKDSAAFLVGDKTLGKVTLDEHPRRNIDYEKLVADKQAMLASDNPPPRGFQDEPDGKSGNRKLGVQCSYCEFKEACWPNLQKFNYAGKPRWLTVVKKEPRVRRDKDPF